MQDIGDQLRARGMRMTPQRRASRRRSTGSGTPRPRTLAATVARDGGAALPPSTVYRTLEALEDLGVVGHTHLDHRAPTYHLADHADHLHLVCRGCGRSPRAPEAYADAFAGNLLAGSGFVADVTHMAIHGGVQRAPSSRGT